MVMEHEDVKRSDPEKSLEKRFLSEDDSKSTTTDQRDDVLLQIRNNERQKLNCSKAVPIFLLISLILNITLVGSIICVLDRKNVDSGEVSNASDLLNDEFLCFTSDGMNFSPRNGTVVKLAGRGYSLLCIRDVLGLNRLVTLINGEKQKINEPALPFLQLTYTRDRGKRRHGDAWRLKTHNVQSLVSSNMTSIAQSGLYRVYSSFCFTERRYKEHNHSVELTVSRITREEKQILYKQKITAKWKINVFRSTSYLGHFHFHKHDFLTIEISHKHFIYKIHECNYLGVQKLF